MGVILLLMQDGAPSAAQADDPCSTPNLAPTFLPRDSRSTPQPTRTPLPYDPCAPSQTPSPSPSALPALPQTGQTGIVSLYRPSDRTFYLRYSQTGQYHERTIHLAYALPGDKPVVGDWDGDGYTNVGVYRPSSAQFLLTTSEAAVVTDLTSCDYVFTYGNPGALPLVGKWTAGAAADSIGVWQDGVFAFRQSLTDASTTHKTYGNAADTPLVGNWAGDGVDRPAVWRDGQGMFYLDNNNVTQTVLFGSPGDAPLAGDWDGDGIDGIGVRREGLLYLTNTLSGVGEVYQTAFYGLPSDVAMVGVWRALSAGEVPPPVGCAVAQCEAKLIPFNQYQTYSFESVRVLQDMLIVSDYGLGVLRSPTINSRKSVKIASWNDDLHVYQRIVFPQRVNGISDQQIWYEVGGEGLKWGWIPVRYQGQDYTLTTDPCLNTISPNDIVFEYDRVMAAHYAIEQSWNNAFSATPLPDRQVTRRLLAFPYAEFRYAYLSGSPGSTGSTMFVSEAIWAGGLPMTIGSPQSCIAPPSSSISEGWRYCASNVGSSNPWDFHQQLLQYYTHTPVPLFNYPNAVLQPPNLGYRLDFSGCGTFKTDRIWSGNSASDLADLNPNFLRDREGIVVNAQQLETFISNVLSCNGQTLLMGDYIYINPQKPGGAEEEVEDSHGLLVVGWGPLQTQCSFSARQTITELSVNRTSLNTVPYVADFTNAQPPIARPFYCTMAYDDGATGTYFYRHDWFFFHIPDKITLTPDEIYVDEHWNW